jgi:serine/threonine protein kinase
MADGTFAAIIAGGCGFILLLLLWRFMNYRREKSDEVWKVNVDELHFSHPAEVIGQGAFGVVLLAEYRGTNVAIKRVLPIKKKGKSKMSGSMAATSNEVIEDSADDKSGERAEEHESYDVNCSQDIEAPLESFGVRRGSLATTSGTGTGDNSKLGFLVGLGQRRRKQSAISRMLFGSQEISAYNMNVLGTASAGSSTRRGMFASVFPWCDVTTQRQTEFKEEMRLLSRLRHPCKLSTFAFSSIEATAKY